MSYSLCDENAKFVGDAPCINGLRELKEFVQDQGAEKFPAITQLFQHGYTNMLVQLGIECRNLGKRAVDNKDIRSSALSIGKAAVKAKELLVLEDA